MRIRLVTLVSATTIAALLGSQATGLAVAPETHASAPSSDATVHGEARIVDQSVVLHTDAGALRVADGQLRIVDPHDTVVGSIPLTILRQDIAFPIDAQVDGDTATLTPRLDQGRPITAEERRISQVAPIADADSPEDRMNTAMGNVNNELTVALAVGTLLGAIIGGPLGCVVLGLPTGGVGCLAGAVVGAGMGVVVFNLLIGVPALIASGVHFYNVMTAPPATDTSL